MTWGVAPDKRDIFWPNMDKIHATSIPKKFIVDVLVFMLIVLYIVPATALAMVCSVDALKKANPRLIPVLEDHKFVETLLTFIHPTLLVLIVNLLPPIFTGLGLFEGCVTWSLCSKRQMDRFLWFCLVNVLLVTTMTGQFYDTM